MAPPVVNTELSGVWGRCDGPSRLLLAALMSGSSGASRAAGMLRGQQGCNAALSLGSFMEVLCQEEIPQNYAGQLKAKPLVCLLPAAFQHNLLSFLHLVNAALPRTGALRLLRCLGREPRPNPWVTSLVRQLHRDLGASDGEPLHTPTCSQRIKTLSGRPMGIGPGEAGGWTRCFGGEKASPAPEGGPPDPSSGRGKRKSSCVISDSDEETGRQSKRKRTDSSPVEAVSPGEPCDAPTSVHPDRDPPTGLSAQARQPADARCDVLSEHVKASVPRIKELLECPTEWDQSSTDVFQVLNECDPPQVEALCGMLRLPDTPEQTLPKLCGCLLALTPDLSHSAAVTLIRSLLLGKVLSLSEAASRCLVSAATALCGRYPRATCHAVIGPVLQAGNIGTHHAELLSRLIEDCLEPHYRLLVFQMTLEIAWGEAALSIIHSLLDSKLELNAELFADFTAQLVGQAPRFNESMKYAKMALTVLTKYSSYITAAHKQSLSGCLTPNATFLKKSLQAALRRIA